MATVVCQGLQSCLDSQLVESRTLRLRFSSPKPHFSQSLEFALRPCFSDSNILREPEEKCDHEEINQKVEHVSPKPDIGGWSFLRSLPDTNQPSDKETVYVHPLVKRSTSKLSEKSLELCTENLGSETGTDIIDINIFSLSKVESSSTPREQQSSRRRLEVKKANSRRFPPPLTTMTGSKSLQMRPYREDGRLVIKAVKSPSMSSCFQVERSHGRLLLRFVKDPVSRSVASTEENELISEGDDKNVVEIENDMIDDQFQQEDCGCYEEETDENEKGIEDFQTLNFRCKEEGQMEKKPLINLDAFWVAT
ncbi:hypothetical protein K2173_022280 [Erythroxylum novogranatense]|uniref:FAF domain-containing protein n=1 Tax=Erythroxylum novogranatense TaxID=1862640 RepID=A0AAV8THB8_9ROSI|nr:hypothetical protein K2173_022280 [Erythroxylum novogranatense]